VAVDKAYKDGLVIPILVGDTGQIKQIVRKNKLSLGQVEMHESRSFQASAETSVKLIHEGKGDVLIKGLLDTSIILKAVLNDEWGLKTGRILSHVMLYEVPSYHKLLMLTDGGMVTYPDLDIKKELIINAVEAARGFNNNLIKVACLAAKEKVNPKMQATVDGFELKKLGEAGYFGKQVLVEGPISLDLAISNEAARIKGYKSPVAGDADLLVVPNIEMGNGIGKAITYFGNGIGAGVVMGAKVPIILVSRADTFEAKYYSILFGSMIAVADK